MCCNKWLVTQPPFCLMCLEREVFHICRLPRIFHFTISVDIKAAFIPLAGLVLMLFQWPGPGLIPVTSWLISAENTCCWVARPIVTQAGPVHFFVSSQGQAFLCRLGPGWAPLVLQRWGSRGWSYLLSAWSSSFSWQFSSSLASWSRCPHLKVRANHAPCPG